MLGPCVFMFQMPKLFVRQYLRKDADYRRCSVFASDMGEEGLKWTVER